MAGVVLEFSHHGDFDSFGIIRSSTPTTLTDLPAPLVTGLSTMFYVDTTVVEGEMYYYRPVVWRDGEMAVGDEISIVVTAGDVHWDKVAALLHFDADLTDKTGKIWTARGSASVSDAQSVFGGKSLKTPSGNSSITAPHHTDFDFSDGDFTIELWVYLISRSHYGVFVSKRLNGGFHAPFVIQEGGGGAGTCFYASKASGQWHVKIIGNSLPLATWVHLAFVRNGDVFTGYINGNSVGSTTVSGALLSNSNAVSVGADGDNNYGINGYIDEFRITKGVARYTENFTPPERAFREQ